MESEDTCSCTPQDQSDYWESLRNQFEDQSVILKAKELELRQKIAQVESLMSSGHSSSSWSCAEVPKVFPRKSEGPEKDVVIPSESPSTCVGGFLQKVMENAKSILAMKCSAVHPSNTASEEPTRETDPSCSCDTESKSTSSKAVSFVTVPQTMGSSSEVFLYEEDSTTKNDTTADSYSQEVNNSYCCSVTGSSSQTGSRKEGFICSSCCLASTTPTTSKQGSRVASSYSTSTYNISRRACSCNTSMTQNFESAARDNKIVEAVVDTSSRDTRMITSPCQICCEKKARARLDQQTEARMALDANSTKKSNSSCQVCIEIRRPTPSGRLIEAATVTNPATESSCQICAERRSRSATKSSDKQIEAQAATYNREIDAVTPTVSRATRIDVSPCGICPERGIQVAINPFDKQIEAQAQAATYNREIEAVTPTVARATRIDASPCGICPERGIQVAVKPFDKQIEAQAATSSKAISGNSQTPSDKQIEAVVESTSRATRITGSTCRVCTDKNSKTGTEAKEREKPSYANLQSCWVNPLQSAPKRSKTKDMFPSRDDFSSRKPEAGDLVPCTPETCSEKRSASLKKSGPDFAGGGAKGNPCTQDTCPDFKGPRQTRGDFSGNTSRQLPCTQDTCPDFGGDTSKQLPCTQDTCPDFERTSSKQLPCTRNTCPDFGGNIPKQAPCTQNTCPDFGGNTSKQSPCTQNTCPDFGRNSTKEIPCTKETCPDFSGPKRGPCRDDTCPVVLGITKNATYPDVSSEKRTEKRKSTCSVGTCPSAKKVRSRSNIRDMDNQCAFIGSPVLNSSNFKSIGDSKGTNVECPCCTATKEPPPAETNAAKCIKCHMQELLQREKNYDSVFKMFQSMACQPTYCCAAAAEKNHAQGDVRRITDELRLENQLLKSELKELKYEMKNCMEKIEGPMKQKLQTERCKCEKLQHELARTSEDMAASQDGYLREMNALKMQLCVACSNMTDLNAINKRLKEEAQTLDCMCSKLEDDLLKQKLNEADTIRMMSKRNAGFGDVPTPPPCAPCQPQRPQQKQSETFRCDSNLHVIARKLSKTLKEIAPCEQCSKLPELTGAAKLIKDLTDLVESRKIARPCSMESIESKRDCSCQSPPQTEDEWCQCNNFRDVGAGKSAAMMRDAENGDFSKPTETLFSVPPTFAEINESSHFGMKPDVVESQYYPAAPCPQVCDETAPCATIDRPCQVSEAHMQLDEGAVKPVTVETGTVPCPAVCNDPAPCAPIGKPCVTKEEAAPEEKPVGKITTETGTVPCPEVCGDTAPCVDIGKPCVTKKPGPEQLKTTTDTGTVPCPQICGDTAPCADIGKPCDKELPSHIDVKPPPEPISDKITEPAEPEPPVEQATPEEPPKVPSVSPKPCTCPAPAEPVVKLAATPAEILEGIKRASISSAEEAVKYITGVLLQSITTLGSKEKAMLAMETKHREAPPVEGVARDLEALPEEEVTETTSFEKTTEVPQESPLEGGIEPERAEEPKAVTEDFAKSEPAVEERAEVEDEAGSKKEDETFTLPEVTSKKSIEELPPKQPGEIPERTSAEELKVVDEPTADLKISQAPGPDILSQLGAAEEVILEEIELDAEEPRKTSPGDITEPSVISERKTSKVSEEKPLMVPEGKPSAVPEATPGDKPSGKKPSAVAEEEPLAVPEDEPSVEKPSAVAEEEPSVVAEDKPSGGKPSAVPKEKAEIVDKGLFEERYIGDFPLTVETEAVVLEEPPSGLHVTTTITSSGNLEVITEGPAGVIETSLNYKEDGTIEVITQITELSSEELGDTEDSSSAVTEGIKDKKRSSKTLSGRTPSPEAAAKFDEAKKKLIDEVKMKESMLSGDSELTGLETVSDYTKDTTTAVSSTGKSSAAEIASKEKATVSPRSDSVTQQTSRVPTYTKSSGEDVLQEATASTEDRAQRESEVSNPTVMEEIALSSHVVVTDKGTADGIDKSEIDVKTSPISTKERGSGVEEKESARQQTSVIDTVRKSTEVDPGVAEGTQSVEEVVEEVIEEDEEKEYVQPALTPVPESGEECSASGFVEVSGVESSEMPQEEEEPFVCSPTTCPKQETPQQDEADERTIVSDIAEDATDSSVKQAAKRQKRDCACQSSTPAEQSCQCCDCKDVGVSTSKDNETNTDPKMTVQKLPVQNEIEDADPISEYVTGEGSQGSRGRDAADGSSLDAVKTQGTVDEISTLHEESHESCKVKERCKEMKKSKAIEDPKKAKLSSESDSENDKSKDQPAKKLFSDPDNEKKQKEKSEAKRRRSSEVPDSVSKLSDRDNPPLITSSEGKRQKKKRTSKLEYSSCDCVGVCQCVVCSPEVIAKRKAMTGSADPPDRRYDKLCCCTVPERPRSAQAPHQPDCLCCRPPRTEALLRTTNLAPSLGAVPKNRRRTSVDDVFLPVSDVPESSRPEEPPKRFPHSRDCECIDCLCLPKIQQIAQTPVFPVVKDEKQIYQVSTVKCDCINAINARKLAAERSRIPIATNSTASPPKIRVPTPAACVCEDCKCSPCGDQAKRSPQEAAAVAAADAPAADDGKPASATASKVKGPRMTPSELAKLCDCQRCDCNVCFNKPTGGAPPVDAVPSEAPPSVAAARSATPAPSALRPKNCCCKGECTCELCPVADGDKAPPSAKPSSASKGSEKLVKASSLSRPEECDCAECVCPNAPPKPPSSGSKLPPAASKTSKPSSAGQKPSDCDCATCVCPEPKAATRAQGDQPQGDRPPQEEEDEECTCEKCDCPQSEAAKKPRSGAPLQPIAECDCGDPCECSPCGDPRKRKAAPPPAGGAMSGPAGAPTTGPVPCDCPVCECSPCADPTKRKKDQPDAPPQPGDVVCDDRSPPKEEEAAPKAATDASAGVSEHPQGCTCDICECPGKDKLKPKASEVAAEKPTEEAPAPESKTEETPTDKHPDDCVCPECLCAEETPEALPAVVCVEGPADVPAKVSHPDNCICAECLCLEEEMVTASDVSQGMSTKPSVAVKADTGTHAKDCICPECKCPGAATQTEAPPTQTEAPPAVARQHVEGCTCVDCKCPDEVSTQAPPESGEPHAQGCPCQECQCVDCFQKTERFVHSPVCQCGECLCVDCDKMEGVGDALMSKPSTRASPTPLASEKNVKKCVCESDAVCGDCYFSVKSNLEYKECKCGVCLCQDCEYMEKETARVEATQQDASTAPPVAEAAVATTPAPAGPTVSCHCIDCQCDVCSKERSAEIAARSAKEPQPEETVTPGAEHPNTCTCLACICIECFDRAKIGAGDKPGDAPGGGPGVPAARSMPGPTATGEHNPNCKCVNCTCTDCGKLGPGGVPPPPVQTCNCAECNCLDCAYRSEAQATGAAAAPEGDQPAPAGQDPGAPIKSIAEMRSDEPPPFETPVRNPCDCNTCMCVICVDKREAAGRTAEAVPSGGPVGAAPPAAAGGEAPPFEVPVRMPCTCGECVCPGRDKLGLEGTTPAGPEGAPTAGDPTAGDQTAGTPAAGDPAIVAGSKVLEPATAEAPPFDAFVRLPCNCMACVCSSCHKEGGQAPVPPLIQEGAFQPQSTPALSFTQKASVSNRPSSAPGGDRPASRMHCECPTCVCPSNALNFQAGNMSAIRSTELRQVSCQPSHASGKQMSAQTSRMSGKQSQPGQVPIHCKCPSCHCPSNILTGPTNVLQQQASKAPSVPSPKPSTQPATAQPSTQQTTAQPSTQQTTAQPSTEQAPPSSQQATAPPSVQATAQQSRASGKQPEGAVASCDCPTCVCAPCPDVKVSSVAATGQDIQPSQPSSKSASQATSKLLKKTEYETDDGEPHSGKCTCPACCICDARMAEMDLSQMNDAALEKKIQKDRRENCECREQIKEIRKALTKIKCACTEAELKAMNSKPLVKQASAFGQTMSGLKLALTNLQEKCKAKDKMIDAMTGELKQRTSSKTFDKVLNKSNSAAPDYDKADDVKSLSRSHEAVSTNVLYTVDEEKDAKAKEGFDAKMSRAMETEKKKKKSSKTCRCGKSHHKSKDPQKVDLGGFEIVDIRRITQDSVIIKWKPPRGSGVTGYDIFINGVNKSKVMSGGRTSAMIHSLDLSATIQVTIYAVTKCGRCEPPAIAIYEIRP